MYNVGGKTNSPAEWFILSPVLSCHQAMYLPYLPTGDCLTVTVLRGTPQAPPACFA